MAHLLAANAVLLLHLLFICLVMLGGLAVSRWPRFALIHVPAAVWGTLVEGMGWYCPLTDLENALLRKAGDLPAAHIAGDGQLVIAGNAIAMDDNARALARDYRRRPGQPPGGVLVSPSPGARAA